MDGDCFSKDDIFWLARFIAALKVSQSPSCFCSTELRDLLVECREYLDQRADADQPSGETPSPNEEMKLLIAIDNALDGLR